MARKQQTGFTIIELVITITIIAILAAIALPRYVALQSDARIAKLQAAAGSVKSAAALAKAVCLTQTATGSTTSLLAGGCNAAPAGTVGVIMDGANVLTGFSYPTAAAAGIGLAAQLLATDYTLVFAPPLMTVRVPGASTPANCQFTYTWNPVANGSPTVSVPITTGC